MQSRTLFLRIFIAVLFIVGIAFLISRIDLSIQKTTPEPSPTPGTFKSVPTEAVERAKVIKVVDGDTIRILLNGEEKAVRLIGINTPETVDPTTPDECYGKEASAYATVLLLDQEIAMAPDESQQDMDRYGRLLRYIYLANGLFVNEKLIREGFATEYTYDRPYQFQQQFRQVEKEAQHAGLGLWEACSATPDPNILPIAQ